MRNKVLATMMAVVMCFVSIPFMKPQQTEAWGNTTVYMTYRHYLGTIYAPDGVWGLYDVTFFRESKTKYESWRTYGYTKDNEFGNNKLISNMTLWADVSLNSNVLNDPNKFSYGYRNK